MQHEPVDPERILHLPFTDVLLGHVQQSEEELFNAAVLGFSGALGNHPELLTSDPGYLKFVADYISDYLVPYVAKAGADQLALLNSFAADDTERLKDLFFAEFTKVQAKVLPDEEAAHLIQTEPLRSLHYFMAVTAVTAVICKQNPRTAELFGLKRGLLGRWSKRLRSDA